jgi:hypothetical protein
MKKRLLITCFASLFCLAISAAVAQQTVPDVIDFDGVTGEGGFGEIFRSVYSGSVKFTHSKHVKDYGAVCGDCHHDSDAEPIESHDPEATYACGECHEEEGLIRGPISENEVSDGDRLAHRANALHLKCIGCHKLYNELNNVIRVPESCVTCHARQSPDWVIK